MRQRVLLLVAYGIVVGSNGFLCVVDAPVAVGKLQCPLSTECSLLGGRLGVGFAVLCRGIEVFAQCIELVALFHSLFSTAPRQEHAENYYVYNKEYLLLHTINHNATIGDLLLA